MEFQINPDVTFVLSERSEDAISEGLRFLTKYLIENNFVEAVGFGLGEEFGYGTNFENETFMLHKFCWCEQDECPWCAGCECPESSFHYFVDDNEVSWHDWLKYYEDRVPKNLPKNWEQLSDEANSHRTSRHDPICDFCLGKGIFSQYGGVSEGRGAPNFWHKSSGLKVWWYKWIGRDMEIVNPEGNLIDWDKILKSCVDSL